MTPRSATQPLREADREAPLPHRQGLLALAFHEAGHAVLHMAYGVHVIDAELTVSVDDLGWGGTVNGRVGWLADGVSVWRLTAACAAGQLAQDRFLREAGLWTPGRAAECESGAAHDVGIALDLIATYGPPDACATRTLPTGRSWGTIGAVAERTVKLLWPQITVVAHALAAHTVLSGDAIAEISGLTNRPNPQLDA
ncbi:hypothetical protein ACFV3E_36655 [Streptomyces sp. NPDC059718]